VQVPAKVWVFLWHLAHHSLPSGDARTNVALKLLYQPMYPPESSKICVISRYCNWFELSTELMYCRLAVIYMYAIVMVHKLNEPSHGNFSMVFYYSSCGRLCDPCGYESYFSLNSILKETSYHMFSTTVRNCLSLLFCIRFAPMVLATKKLVHGWNKQFGLFLCCIYLCYMFT
jgi:hypothetical protein